ncbi:MAG: hypothetical protein B7Y41_10130 [Hydrogenophilales bacterium 28-61-23]|nr:MAG: hypothetical protein B7Y41_10130 [Hydrogenophilales bacterium 28-61-23]
MPSGSTASGDIDPQPPVEVTGLNLVAGGYLTFTGVTGATSYAAGCPDSECFSADGDVTGVTDYLGGSLGFINRAWAGYPGGENGISDVTVPLSSLVGVFLDGSQPDLSLAPGAPDFRLIGLDFDALSPELKQVFFIGDGLTSTNAVQQFFIPVGATRLYLGTMDGYGWTGNNGSIVVTVDAVPEPETYALLLVGLGLVGAVTRRRKQALA